MPMSSEALFEAREPAGAGDEGSVAASGDDAEDDVGGE